MTADTAPRPVSAEQAERWGKNRGFRCHETLYRAYAEAQKTRGLTITDGIIEHMERVTGVKNEAGK